MSRFILRETIHHLQDAFEGEPKPMGLLAPQNTILHLQGAANLHLTEEDAYELREVMAALGVTDFGHLIMTALPILQEYLEAHPDHKTMLRP